MPIPLIGKVLLGATLATLVVMKDGIIEVNVQEHRPNGDHIHLYVPATVATWGVHLAPEERLKEHLRQSKEHLAIARAALKELEKLPDAVLVEVESPKEHVRVATHSGSFVVDVNDPGETVHVSLPIRAARKVVEDLESEAPTS
jgi:hypothetical protein